jgi:hypothetical protein
LSPQSSIPGLTTQLSGVSLNGQTSPIPSLNQPGQEHVQFFYFHCSNLILIYLY